MASIIPIALLNHSLLTDNDKHTLIRPSGVSYQRNALMFIEGLLVERGSNRLSESKRAAIVNIGIAAGRTLVAELLADNTQSAAHPERPLTASEAAPFTSRITRWKNKDEDDPRPPLTCEKLLGYLGRIRAEIGRRMDAEARERQLPKP